MNFNEIQRGTPCKMYRISMKSLREPLAKCTEFRWNPKGHPLQNARNFNEILRGTLCKMLRIWMKSLGVPFAKLQNTRNFNWFLRGTPCKKEFQWNPKGYPWHFAGGGIRFHMHSNPRLLSRLRGVGSWGMHFGSSGCWRRLQRNWGTPWGASSNSLTFAGCACKYSIMKSSVSSIACWACRVVEGMEGRLAGFMAGCPADYTKPEWLRVVWWFKAHVCINIPAYRCNALTCMYVYVQTSNTSIN